MLFTTFKTNYLLSRKRKKTLYITHEKGHQSRGSFILRGKQIAQLLRNDFNCKIASIEKLSHKKDEAVLFIKPDSLSSIEKISNNKVIIDPLDNTQKLLTTNNTKLEYVYGCIFCSSHSKNTFQHLFDLPEYCTTIYHHWDARLKDQTHNTPENVKTAYIGLAKKIHLPDAVAKTLDITIFPTPDFNALQNPELYNFSTHYTLKPNNNVHEPLTKIATASFFNANVIALKNPPNIELLGKDYPFFCKTLSERDIIDTYQFLVSSFGSNLWYDSLETMRNIKQVTSPHYAAKQYKELIKNVLDS